MKSFQSSGQEIDPKKLSDIDQDKEAFFLAMMDDYQDAIFRFLYFRVSSRPVALDITQDTFTRIWNYLSSGKKIDYPEAFVYRSAKNALIDYYKKERPLSLDTMIDSGYDPGTSKDTDEVLRQDDIASIRELMEGLDEEAREIIHLRFAEEKPIEEIALMFGKSTNAMTVHIHRLIKKLRVEYEQKNGR